jgi:4-alpha-glucanotransferase
MQFLYLSLNPFVFQMAKYFSAYRIDHVLGFFRIWEMPDHAVTGLMGRFRPSIPLSTEELEREGIWDFNRLSTPYVRCHILIGKFGDRWTEVADKYFDEFEHLCYQFKEQYNTEKKIVVATTLEDDAPESAVQEAEADQARLFELLHEVLLMRDSEDPAKFYPRFGLDQTASFDELDDHSKNVLRSKYHDYFFHRQEQLWRDNALMTLPALLNSSDMLCCGEDLGMVPACVQPVLSELGLLGLRIQRMPSASEQEFGNPAEYEYMTVCAPSCHDSSTMRAWWEEDRDRRERFLKTMFNINEIPPETCDPHISHLIVQQHLESPSMWAIFPIQDLLALKEDYTDRAANEETINDPTNPRHYWRFRLHVPMETLLGDDDFLGTIRDLVVSSGRASDKDFEQVNASMETSAIECEPAVSVQEVSLPAHRNISGVVLNDKKAALERSFSGRVLDDNKHVVEIGCTGRSLVTAL